MLMISNAKSTVTTTRYSIDNKFWDDRRRRRRRRRRRARSRLTRWERTEHLRLGLVCGRWGGARPLAENDGGRVVWVGGAENNQPEEHLSSNFPAGWDGISIAAIHSTYLSKVLHHLKTLLSFKTPDDMCLETSRSVKEANNGRAWVVEPKGFNKDLNDLFR